MKKYLAFDVGGTSVKYAVVNEEGEVSSSNKFKTPDTLEKMYQEIENVAHEYQDVEGIALSMPGAVDSDGGIIYGSSAIDYIHGPNIKEDLKQRLNKDVEFENDANCAALAEVWKGVACHENDCCFIVSGTGIGGAVIKDRHVHHGNALHGGEFGYMIMRYDQDEKKYYTWSDDGSTVAVTKRVAKELGVDYHTLDGKEVFDQACDRHYGKAPSADRRRIEKCPECTGRCDEDEGRICAGTWRGKRRICADRREST
jgi:predicted NBD/HSP70 family sugar kinase